MREVYISDVHVPEHDPHAWKLALRVVSKVDPDLVYIGGDFGEFESVSSYRKDPLAKHRFQLELDAVFAELEAVRRAAPDARIVFLDGNHEDRITRYLEKDHTEALASLRVLNNAQLLRLPELCMEHKSYGNVERIGKLYHIHGDQVAAGSVNVARNIALRLQRSVLCGHYHTAGQHFVSQLEGDTHCVTVNSCLRTLNPGYTFNPQWTQGLTIVEYSRSGYFHVQPVVFFRVGGRIYSTVQGTELSCALTEKE
jgi:predicted MPP superfamily phosphohydrolase